MVQLSFPSSTRAAFPSTSTPTLSRLKPSSSFTTVAPVRIAMSSRYCDLRSPNPGAFRAQIFSAPLSLFTTKVARASCSISSAMINNGNPCLIASSKITIMSRADLIFLSTSKSLHWSYVQVILSESVTKYGEMYPRSNCMPSTTIRLLSTDLASSRVITPLRPTFSMASLIMVPTSMLPPAETLATLASSSSETSFDSSFNTTISLVTVASMPRVSCTGLVPAMTIFMPSVIIAADKTVAVVVPSPAKSFVFCAACLTSLAPAFSTGSSSSTSFATVTPSLTILGDPYLDSSTTFLPLGPSVTPTTCASLSTPFCIFFNAAPSLALKNNCFAAAVVVVQTRPARRAGNAAVREEQRGESQRIDSFDSTKKLQAHQGRRWKKRRSVMTPPEGAACWLVRCAVCHALCGFGFRRNRVDTPRCFGKNTRHKRTYR